VAPQLRRIAPYAYALAGVALTTALIGLVRSRYAVPDLSMVLPRAGGVAVLTIAADPDDRQRRLLAALLSLGSLLLDRRTAAFQAQRASALEASDGLKAAVLSSLSHELKSPLAALRAGLTALTGPGTGLDAEHVELVLGLDREATRLDRLVGELLTMSRLESGQDLVLEARSYPEIAGAVLERMAHQLADRRLLLKFPDDLPAVPIDELQVDRLLTNLVDNAIVPNRASATGSGSRTGSRLMRHSAPRRRSRTAGRTTVPWSNNETAMIP